jgi:hypothetical protein
MLSTILVGVVISLIAGLTRLRCSGGAVSIGTLLAFVLKVSIGVIILRKTRPTRPARSDAVGAGGADSRR